MTQVNNSLVTVQLARFVRDLLEVPDNTVRQASRGFTRAKDLSQNQIAVGALGSAMRVSAVERYDSAAEQMTYTNHWRQQCTLDFYGQDDFEWAHRFGTMAASQLGLELQQRLGLTVMRPAAITDLSGLTGQQYDPRHQVEVNVHFAFSTTVPVLRIDESVLKIRSERRVVLNEITNILLVNDEPLYVNGKPLRVTNED